MTDSPALHASEALRHSEAELRALLAAMPDIVIVFDHEGRYRKIVSSNPRLLYAPIESRIGKRVTDTLPPPVGEFFMEHIQRSLATGERITASYQLPLEGRNVWFEAAIAPVDAQTVIWVARDITDWQLAEIALRESEERLAQALEAADAAVYEWDIVGERMYLTPGWAEQLGLDPKAPAADQATWRAIIHPDDWPRVTVALAVHLKGSAEAFESEYRVRTGKKRWLWVLDRGRVVARDAEGRATRMIGTHVNITDRKRLLEQLTQAQKMEAVGRLAGGIAHDFNNVLTAILGTGELLLADLPTHDPHRSDIEEILQAANRAAALTRQLLAFSRRQVLQPKVVDLNALMQNLERMLRRLIGEDVELVTVLAPEIGRVRADPSQLEQVLLNLCVNARDAMPHGGRLVIETANVSLAPDTTPEGVPIVPGDYVMVVVTDTGVGMDAETRAHLFEPFFTTKAIGQGTGLGLAMVYGVVKQSGGYITVTSQPEQGACFRIYLPRVASTAEAAAETPAPVPAGGGETVLLVEDEPSVRRLNRRALETAGYTVLEAADGAEAVTLAAGFEAPIHLLLTDVVMPGLNGLDLAKRLKAHRPSLQVVYTSGYPDTAHTADAGIEDDAPFLQKPYSADALTRKVREVLEVPRR